MSHYVDKHDYDYVPPPLTKEQRLEAENACLRAELEALKPKPVITVQYGVAELRDVYDVTDQQGPLDNLKLVFENRKLIKAEVIK